MKFSTIKQIKKTTDDNWRDVVEAIANEESDSECGNFRVISSDNIDEILKEELSSDEYYLGCFSSWAVSDATGIDSDVIYAMKEAEAFEAIGKLILSIPGALSKIAQILVDNDGYGHHFNTYDGGEVEMENHYIFRIN